MSTKKSQASSYKFGRKSELFLYIINVSITVVENV